MAQTSGYLDWQRVDNWESPTLYRRNEALGALSRSFTSEVIDVRRYQNVQMVVKPAEGFMAVTLEWFAEPEAGFKCGERTVLLDARMESRFAGHFLNHGAYVRVSGETSVANVVVELLLTGSNRNEVVEAASGSPFLFFLFRREFNPGTGQIAAARGFFGGPVQIVQRSTNTECTVSVDVVSPRLELITLAEIRSLREERKITTLVIPTTSTEIEVINNSEVTRTSIEAYVIPSFTGAT